MELTKMKVWDRENKRLILPKEMNTENPDLYIMIPCLGNYSGVDIYEYDIIKIFEDAKYGDYIWFIKYNEEAFGFADQRDDFESYSDIEDMSDNILESLMDKRQHPLPNIFGLYLGLDENDQHDKNTKERLERFYPDLFCYEKKYHTKDEWIDYEIAQTPSARKDVIQFIAEVSFHCKATTAIYELFQQGYCYYFALMLKDAFGGEMMWHKFHSHIVWQDENGVCYDSMGVFEDYDKDDIVPLSEIDIEAEKLGRLEDSGLETFRHRIFKEEE